MIALSKCIGNDLTSKILLKMIFTIKFHRKWFIVKTLCKFGCFTSKHLNAWREKRDKHQPVVKIVAWNMILL